MTTQQEETPTAAEIWRAIGTLQEGLRQVVLRIDDHYTHHNQRMDSMQTQFTQRMDDHYAYHDQRMTDHQTENNRHFDEHTTLYTLITIGAATIGAIIGAAVTLP